MDATGNNRLSLDVDALYNAGIKRLADIHDDKEAGKLGILRAGNTGIVIGSKFAGQCARQTLLRLEGIKYEEIEDNKRLMFDAGLSNEDIWIQSLVSGLAAKGLSDKLVIRREEEVPISWTIPSGILVTGRPDIVLGTEGTEGTFSPMLGLELKLVSSTWTARDVGVMLEPKLQHLMQAAHYSWQLNVPFQLWYTNRAEFSVGSGWEQSTFPKKKDLLTDVLEFGTRKDKRTGRMLEYVKKIKQFRQGFQLEWTDKGQLKYKPLLSHTDLSWTLTPITQDGIIKYYEAVVAQKTKKKLAPRPSVLKADGSEGNFKACDYCPLKSICDSADNEYDKWMEMVSSMVNNVSRKV